MKFRLLGLCYEAVGTYTKALDMFKKAYRQHPWDADTAYRISQAYSRLHDSKNYEIWIKTYLRLDDDSIDGFIEYVVFLLKEKKPEIALSELYDAQKANPSNPDIYVLMGKTYLLLHHFDMAIQSYQTAVLLAPDNLSITTDAIKVLRVFGKNKEAEQIYNHIVKKFSKKEIEALLNSPQK